MSVAECLRSGDQAFGVNDLEKALSHYNEASDWCDSEDASDVDLKKAQCLAGLGRFKEALEIAETHASRNPQSVAAYAIQGKCLTALVKYEDAYKAYKKGLDIDPKDKAVALGLRELQNAIVAQYEEADKMEESNYDALKMCSQEPYPGDEAVEVLEKEIMKTWKLDDPPGLNVQIPDKDKSKCRLLQALKARADGNLEQALEAFTAALELDATNFENWKGRIEILYERKDFREAFRTVSSFPEQARSSATWLLGGKILVAMELPLSAERWLRRATQLNKNPDDNEAAILFQKVRVGRLYGPLTIGTNADVTFTQYGRAVCSTKDLGHHDIVLTDKPVVLAQTLDSQTIPACSHCGVSMLKPSDVFSADELKKEELKKALAQYWPKRKIHSCEHCTKEIYCSIECRDEAWARYHRVICLSVNKPIMKLYEICEQYLTLKNTDGRAWKGWWNASFSPFILVRMWASIVCEAKRLACDAGRDNPVSEDWSLAQAPLRR